MSAARVDEPGVYDVVGIGFGPSNLALAVALEEHNAQVGSRQALRGLFAEKQRRFGWHRGMLIDDATMQVSFLKDLVTMRNPTSPFSFLAYLRHHGRLADFINHKTLYPSRVEFHDYLEWVATSFDPMVEYGCEVVDIRPVERDGDIVLFDVESRPVDDPDAVLVRRTRNIVLARGLQPHLPPGVTPGNRVWHNEELLHRLQSLPDAPPRSFLVVGAGQSAAETVEYLHRRFPDSTVYAVFSRFGYAPADDSAFVNRIFDPEAVDQFFDAPDDVKQMIMSHHRNTNYSVVDLELIDELYRRVYQEKVRGEQRLTVLNLSQIVDLQVNGSAVRATVEFLPRGELSVIDADYVIYATGYRPAGLDVLGTMAGYCRTDDHGRVRVSRDYRVETTGSVRAGIYLQGPTEHTHGISSTLLSNTAVRVGELVQSLAASAEAAARTGQRDEERQVLSAGR
ncbi:lysine/ornithine N-monooxygenase [Longimycelium tulufanense]|uniref:L-lysine N6-monooxygenase MbtG n=1 Tax=Longimycelium tulufanense TaxID=907463 RepID=A0A8J3FTT3_9PSEU|nr:lysine N(6)-hydroxylase/L-ornithine N(5)-oxygenase family protein [Longimycelium tulufanense]GGM49170.1 lysine/ornithine N-monooxygenase [Longimycelium tulufanense]